MKSEIKRLKYELAQTKAYNVSHIEEEEMEKDIKEGRNGDLGVLLHKNKLLIELQELAKQYFE